MVEASERRLLHSAFCVAFTGEGPERAFPGFWPFFFSFTGEGSERACQRIVTVNPQGWSRMAPLLAKMKEDVILVQETFLEPGKIAKAQYEAKA
eukprot:2115181-Amphidinium_carterae.1